MAESVATAKIVRLGNESHKRRTSVSGRSFGVVAAAGTEGARHARDNLIVGCAQPHRVRNHKTINDAAVVREQVALIELRIAPCAGDHEPVGAAGLISNGFTALAVFLDKRLKAREVVFQRIMAAINKEVRAIIAGKRKSAAIFRWPAWAKPIRIFDRRPKSGVAKTFPRLCSRRKSRDQAGARDE